ncbi:hypothetical protein [Lysobacter capsici]|uniref:hypothetical protein n=1 Tax=Lysobacter capsici TaxID=435897 RepID=UPI001C0086AF|nr:hypothetical protein [Lysobacter capsici]QWF19554.1 hypothetical protein KME82_12810 [Lysobacter capsici]
MQESDYRRNTDERTAWGWRGFALAAVVFIGIVGAAGGTAYQIGKQQAAADERNKLSAERAAVTERQIAQAQVAQIVAERNALRDRVLELETQLLAERSAQPQQQASLRCINGELVVRRGNSWSSAGHC